LAAWDELQLATTGLATDARRADARAWQLAWAANHEFGIAGLMLGGYWRDFTDADGQSFDFDDRTELVFSLRPQVYPTHTTAIGIEISQQEVRPRGLEPRTVSMVAPSVTKLSVLPAWQAGRGGYARPRLHLVYTVTWMNDDARALYDPRDVRISEGDQHFLGIGAEWWLNSRSYR
jgi:maltoporin